MRWGWSSEIPRRSFLFSSYSWKLPSNQYTWLFPSKAKIWVAIRSRNQRSWEITTAQPAKLRWKRWKYDISEKEIDMLRGIFIKKRTLVPINRVQHVDTRQGPVYRKFGLSSVTISTAATTHEIPALDDETADKVRDTISNLVRKVKGDV